MRRKLNRILIVLLLVCLVSAPFASAQYTDSITVLGGLGAISRDALEEMLDLVACKCAGGGGCECGSGGGGACACECTCEICTFLKAHPVGSIYMGTTSANPQTTYGGEWEQWGQGRVPVGAAGNGVNPSFTDYDGFLKTFAADETGGEYWHTLTIPEIPGHTHIQDAHTHIQDAHTHTQDAHTHTQDAHTHTQDAHSHSFLFGGRALTLGVSSGADINTGLGGGSMWGGSNWNGNSNTLQATTATNQNATATNQNATATNQNATAVNQSTGDGLSHNNVQPYVACYMWRRTGEGTSLCTNGGCACGGGSGGTGGGCDCEPYTATLPISITDNDISIDLSGYVTAGGLTTALGDYVASSSLTTILGSYVTSTSLTTTLTGYVTTSGLTTALGNYIAKADVKAPLYMDGSGLLALGTTTTGYALVSNGPDAWTERAITNIATSPTTPNVTVPFPPSGQGNNLVTANTLAHTMVVPDYANMSANKGGSWTVDKPGFVYAWNWIQDGYCYVNINGQAVGVAYFQGTSNWDTTTGFYPVAAGDVVTLTANNGYPGYIYWFPPRVVTF